MLLFFCFFLLGVCVCVSEHVRARVHACMCACVRCFVLYSLNACPCCCWPAQGHFEEEAVERREEDRRHPDLDKLDNRTLYEQLQSNKDKEEEERMARYKMNFGAPGVRDGWRFGVRVE